MEMKIITFHHDHKKNSAVFQCNLFLCSKIIKGTSNVNKGSQS